MNSDTNGPMQKQRESRRLWAVTENDVREVTGYSCAPQHPDMWWCPEAGFSGTLGGHLFNTKAEALDAAILEIQKEIAWLNQQATKLINARVNLR